MTSPNPLPSHEIILEELRRFVSKSFRIERAVLDVDPTFEDMGADSMTRLEILIHGDDTFGSHVLDQLEDGLIEGEPPTRLSELAALIPLCLQSAADVAAQRKLAANKDSDGAQSGP